MKTLPILLLFPAALVALSEEPWLPEAGELEFETEYTYSRFSHVQGAKHPLHHISNDHELLFDLGLTTTERWNFQADVELADTPEQDFGWRSFAAQARYLCLKDPLDLLFGFNARIVSYPALGDISSPYAAKGNFELFGSLGTSWPNTLSCWSTRLFGTLALGQGTYGSPWLRGDLAYKNRWGHHHLDLFADSYWGLGSKTSVDLEHFHTAHKGWGKYRHFSVDLGIKYEYSMDKWGDVYFSYAYRAFARTFPEHVNFFIVGYKVPLYTRTPKKTNPK